MKRFALLFALVLGTALPAFADTLADQVRVEAARLLAQVNAVGSAAKARPAATPQPVSQSLSSDLQRFGLAAGRLSVEIDQRGGPTDLRCIFRGMSEETDKQLTAASSARRARIRRRPMRGSRTC